MGVRIPIPGVELAAICGTNGANVARLCRRYGGKAYENLEEFLRHQSLDFVIIGSPSGLRALHGIAAARHGQHVLTEKPIDVSRQRADALIRAAEQSGLNLGVIFQDRLKPGLRQLRGSIPKTGAGQDDAGGRAREVVPAPEILRPFAMTRWRSTDGMKAFTRSISCCGSLATWPGSGPAGGQPGMRLRSKIRRWQFSSLSTVRWILEATTAAYPGYPRRLEVAGSRGTLNDQTVAADLRTPRPDIALRFAGTDPSTASPVVSDIGGHQAVFEDFIGAIEQDCTPACDRKQGRRSVELIEAIYRATQNSAMISGSGAGRRPVTRFEEKKLLDEVFDDHNPAGRVFPSGNVRSCARKLGDACRGPGRVAVGYVCL